MRLVLLILLTILYLPTAAAAASWVSNYPADLPIAVAVGGGQGYYLSGRDLTVRQFLGGIVTLDVAQYIPSPFVLAVAGGELCVGGDSTFAIYDLQCLTCVPDVRHVHLNGARVCGMAVGGDKIYLTACGDEIWKFDLAASQTTVLARGLRDGRGIAVDASSSAIYAIGRQTTSSVWRLDEAGHLVWYTSPIMHGDCVTASQGGIYVGDGRDGGLVWMYREDGSLLGLLDGQGDADIISPSAVASGDGMLYVADGSHISVWQTNPTPVQPTTWGSIKAMYR